MRKLGSDHPETLATLNNLAKAYRADGKLPQAIELFERVRDARVKQLRPDHPDTLTTLNNLAKAYSAPASFRKRSNFSSRCAMPR